MALAILGAASDVASPGGTCNFSFSLSANEWIHVYFQLLVQEAGLIVVVSHRESQMLCEGLEATPYVTGESTVWRLL